MIRATFHIFGKLDMVDVIYTEKNTHRTHSLCYCLVVLGLGGVLQTSILPLFDLVVLGLGGVLRTELTSLQLPGHSFGPRSCSSRAVVDPSEKLASE